MMIIAMQSISTLSLIGMISNDQNICYISIIIPQLRYIYLLNRSLSYNQLIDCVKTSLH